MKNKMIVLSIILISILTSIYFYPIIPEKMAIHWNSQGQVDDYIQKFPGMFIIPLFIIGIALLFIVIPKIDPLKENIKKFREYYERFVVLFLGFMLIVHIWLILWNIGFKISPNVIFPIGFGFLFYYIGILCENAKRNWFIGIRTPWTLSNEKVWEKTHKVGGKLFKIAGVIAFVGVFLQNYAIYFIIVPVILIVIYLIIYSYTEYQKESSK